MPQRIRMHRFPDAVPHEKVPLLTYTGPDEWLIAHFDARNLTWWNTDRKSGFLSFGGGSKEVAWIGLDAKPAELGMNVFPGEVPPPDVPVLVYRRNEGYVLDQFDKTTVEFLRGISGDWEEFPYVTIVWMKLDETIFRIPKLHDPPRRSVRRVIRGRVEFADRRKRRKKESPA
jgi:hypothetical protein